MSTFKSCYIVKRECNNNKPYLGLNEDGNVCFVAENEIKIFANGGSPLLVVFSSYNDAFEFIESYISDISGFADRLYITQLKLITQENTGSPIFVDRIKASRNRLKSNKEFEAWYNANVQTMPDSFFLTMLNHNYMNQTAETAFRVWSLMNSDVKTV